MEIRQIRSFLCVAETLHFGRSARLLHLSQPALSLQIKSLEDELGLELLKRNRQGTILTEVGARISRQRSDCARTTGSSDAQGAVGFLRPS